jgi:glycosyltransferase involved in cell wall biosynthesis
MPKLVSVFGVDPVRIGGTETFARELSRQLAPHGWESTLCFQSQPTAEVYDFLKLPNVSFDIVNHAGSQSWPTIRSFARVLKRNRPDIVHLHFTGFLTVFPWLAKMFGARQVFFTDHTSRPTGFVAQSAPLFKKGLVRIINWPLTKVICVSGYGYQCLTQLGLLPNERFRMIYNGVDLSRVQGDRDQALKFRRRYKIPESRTVVLQVSWIIPEKGIKELLRTAQFVLQHRQDVQFVIVGEGAYREQYMKEAELMGLGDHVTWTGLVQDPFGEGVFKAPDIICQLSNWEEVFGWMIAEAMAHEKPIVATRVGGIPELVEDKVSGFLVERGDISDAADAILKLIDDPARRALMGEKGREICERKFSLATNITELIRAYGVV